MSRQKIAQPKLAGTVGMEISHMPTRGKMLAEKKVQQKYKSTRRHM